MNLMERVPLGTKYDLLMQAVKADPAELEAADSVIASILGSPIASIVVGDQITSVKGLIGFISNKMTSEEGGNLEKVLPMLKESLSSESGKRKMSQGIIGAISMLNSDQREKIMSLMEKLSKLPIPGFADTEHADAADFIERAVLPLVERYVADKSPEPEAVGVLAQCPKCSYTFISRMD